MNLVVVVTHGGLGNQLFQMLYGELTAMAHESELRRVHNRRYAHAFAASPAFETRPVPPAIRGLAAVRLPKILHRAGLVRSERISLPGLILLDGYFQHAEQYDGFSTAAIYSVIASLRMRLSITQPADNDTLCHIRLGDFFSSEKDQIAHLEGRFSELPQGSDIVTNRDDLLSGQSALAVLAKAGCRHVPSAALTPEELIALMSRYRRIVANDSTLALWAAVLGNGTIALRDDRLRAMFSLLSPPAARSS